MVIFYLSLAIRMILEESIPIPNRNSGLDAGTGIEIYRSAFNDNKSASCNFINPKLIHEMGCTE